MRVSKLHSWDKLEGCAIFSIKDPSSNPIYHFSAPSLYCSDQSLTNLELCILLSLELPCQSSDILVAQIGMMLMIAAPMIIQI